MTSADWAAWIGAVGTIGAIAAATAVAVSQLRAQRRLSAVERTIALHEAATTQEIGAARQRLSRYMWEAGSTGGMHRCCQPTWEQLLGARYMPIPEHLADLSTYPPEIATGPGQTPLDDLYTILWFFQRVADADHTGLLDPDLTWGMLAHHTVWWGTLCARIDERHTQYVRPLKYLAERYGRQDTSLATWAKADFAQPRPEPEPEPEQEPQPEQPEPRPVPPPRPAPQPQPEPPQS